MNVFKLRDLLLVGAFIIPSTSALALPDELADFYAPPGTFYLQDSSDVELLDYSRVRDVRVCASRKMPNAVGPDPKPVGLTIKYDGRERTVRPGNCFMFEAKNISVTPADTLPDGIMLEGTYDVR
ncbi:hypothetical protein [Emcibacter sp. SYSU 3D8]|uniref:hypothetical protein n=1 Tax=Emcibacter sp. SYSU 3D8 TaxID=3133969 RepID=UPI0031FE9915